MKLLLNQYYVYLSPDMILFGLFLALNLIMGLRAGRKVKTMEEFPIGKKYFSTGLLRPPL